MGNEVILGQHGRDAVVLNGTDVDTPAVYDALLTQHPAVAAMTRWVQDITLSASRSGGGIFARDRYVTPGKTFEQIRTAQDAAESDDVVSGVLETTESLAFTSMQFWHDDEDEEDVWNQWAGDVDLDSRLKEMWRELFVSSQVYVAMWWGSRSYKVRGETTKGITRKRQFNNLQVPISLSVMDPLKVTPVGQLLFGQEQLAYIADRNEALAFDASIGNRAGGDPIVEKLVVGRYEPDRAEEKELREHGVDASNLFLLNPAYVFRHTLTRPHYRRFAEVRMKSVMPLLDLKHQLQQMDRAHLLGGTNFIVLIKKGSEQHPAKPEEIANLQAQVHVVAQVPVIVGDHRLNVEIVTPKTDHTLDKDRYEALNSAIAQRLFQTFARGNSDDTVKTAAMVTTGMEARRKGIRRALEADVIRRIVDRNTNLSKPQLLLHPQKVALTFDSNYAAFLLDLRTSGDLSRYSILAQFGFDEADEAARRKREKKQFDDIFETVVPGAPAPAGTATKPMSPAAKKSAGRRQGGNRNGGGAAPGSGQGKAPRNPRKQSDGSQEGRRQRAAAALEPDAVDVEDTDVDELEENE